MMKMQYKETSEFARDFKKLLKKFRSLGEDLEVVKSNAIELYHCRGLDNQSVFRIPNVGSDSVQIYKVKKFACKALKGKGNRSGMRLIYAYIPKEQKVIFLELYHKADQDNEDRNRIRDFILQTGDGDRKPTVNGSKSLPKTILSFSQTVRLNHPADHPHKTSPV